MQKYFNRIIFFYHKSLIIFLGVILKSRSKLADPSDSAKISSLYIRGQIQLAWPCVLTYILHFTLNRKSISILLIDRSGIRKPQRRKSLSISSSTFNSPEKGQHQVIPTLSARLIVLSIPMNLLMFICFCNDLFIFLILFSCSVEFFLPPFGFKPFSSDRNHAIWK